MSYANEICMNKCTVQNMNITDTPPPPPSQGFFFHIGYCVPEQPCPYILLPYLCQSTCYLEAVAYDPTCPRWYVNSFNNAPVIFDNLSPNPSRPTPFDPNDPPYLWALNDREELILQPDFGTPFIFPNNVMEGQEFLVETINFGQQPRFLKVLCNRRIIAVENPLEATPLQLFSIESVTIPT